MLALALTVLVHFVGLAALIWALVTDDEERPDWRRWWPGDDDGGDQPPLDPEPDPPAGGLPRVGGPGLPSVVRLRAPGRLADAHPRPPRRPAHAPERVPRRVPTS